MTSSTDGGVVVVVFVVVVVVVVVLIPGAKRKELEGLRVVVRVVGIQKDVDKIMVSRRRRRRRLY